MNFSITNSSGTSSVAPGGGAFSSIFCKIFLHMVRHLSLLAFVAIETNPHLCPRVGGGGGSGFTFTGALAKLAKPSSTVFSRLNSNLIR